VTETSCLQAQGLCKQQVPQESWYLSSKLHSIISQQTVIFKALSFSYLLSINFFVITCLLDTDLVSETLSTRIGVYDMQFL